MNTQLHRAINMGSLWVGTCFLKSHDSVASFLASLEFQEGKNLSKKAYHIYELKSLSIEKVQNILDGESDQLASKIKKVPVFRSSLQQHPLRVYWSAEYAYILWGDFS